jgi:hypothetical protein
VAGTPIRTWRSAVDRQQELAVAPILDVRPAGSDPWIAVFYGAVIESFARVVRGAEEVPDGLDIVPSTRDENLRRLDEAPA